MINYDSFTLDNGLLVIVHEDHSTPMAVLNLLYNVGSRDEDESKTGFAHLFEHLMFGGSANIGNFDEPLQLVGGENNAFTSPDITNYYLSVPSSNIETAFWLESDRMLGLSFDPKVLEVQQKVVIEEFKQRYLNQPYGDAWLKLRPLAYQVHPYKWATIGKEISHIENATMQDVKDFFYKFYIPNNAVLVVAGNVTVEQVKILANKWFGPIPKGNTYLRNLPKEPTQFSSRQTIAEGKVPLNAIYMTFPMCERMHDNYHSTDMLSDILGRGQSSRLYQELVKKQNLFSSINCYVSASFDEGLLVIDGKLNNGVTFDFAQNEIWKILNSVKAELLHEDEITKVKNQAISTLLFGEVELLNRAMALAIGAVLGDIDMTNKEVSLLEKVSSESINKVAQEVFQEHKCCTLIYKAIEN